MLPPHFSAYRPAPVTAGTYRARGQISRHEFLSRSNSHSSSSSFFVELQLSDDGSFTACVSAELRESGSPSKYRHRDAPRSPSKRESDYESGFAGTWRRDGDLAVAEVTGFRHGCDAELRPIHDVVELRCVGMVATAGHAAGDHRLIGCAVAGAWAPTLQSFFAAPLGPDRADWIVAGAPNGIELSVSTETYQPGVDVRITPAQQVLTRPRPRR